MLSIIVPVRNESDNLEDIYNYFTKNLKNLSYEVLIINDFSADNTLEKAQSLLGENKLFKVLNNNKKGLGGAVNLGIKKANGSYLTIMMADRSDDINDLIRYENLIKKENLDAVMGSRFLKESKVTDYPIQKLILNRFFNLFVGLIFGINTMITQTLSRFTKKIFYLKLCH